MAKGTISKKRGPSKHSREARRATSPSIDTDKSLKDVKLPKETGDYRPSVLAIHRDAGVTKKAKHGRHMSSKARRRAEKAQDRAADIIERTEQKVARSKGQARNIQSRRKTWDEINKLIPQEDKKTEGHAEEEKDDDENEVPELDEEMGEVEEANAAVVEAAKIPLPTDGMEEDEIS